MNDGVNELPNVFDLAWRPQGIRHQLAAVSRAWGKDANRGTVAENIDSDYRSGVNGLYCSGVSCV